MSTDIIISIAVILAFLTGWNAGRSFERFRISREITKMEQALGKAFKP